MYLENPHLWLERMTPLKIKGTPTIFITAGNAFWIFLRQVKYWKQGQLSNCQRFRTKPGGCWLKKNQGVKRPCIYTCTSQNTGQINSFLNFQTIPPARPMNAWSQRRHVFGLRYGCRKEQTQLFSFRAVTHGCRKESPSSVFSLKSVVRQ
jgi:hypothetical protein